MFKLFLLAAAVLAAPYVCADGYKCAYDNSTGILWTMKLSGNTNGPSCRDVCQKATVDSSVYYKCGKDTPSMNEAAFAPIAALLGFSCKKGGCWDSVAPGTGLNLVSKDEVEAGVRTCYYPSEATLECGTDPGNGNCFGERYSSICPCRDVADLNDACEWDCPNYPLQPKFNDTEASDCLNRINYWRWFACNDPAGRWAECPPQGLPPMTECVGCNECANSQAEYDAKNGAHKSFKRCGEFVQGVGGGSSCANVIDTFMTERKEDVNGTMRCEGHCGPVVANGCQTFFFGFSDGTDDPEGTKGTYVLNWRSCNQKKCEEYCSDPSSNGCFDTLVSPPDSQYAECKGDFSTNTANSLGIYFL